MNASEQSSSHASSNKTGPRAKCDQVVYEAIAKAAEIIVRARCPIISDRRSPTKASSTSSAPSGGTSSSRFHLEVEEVESVRSILQMWKKSLHVPLRLDLYYEYCTDPNQSEQSSRKELLERWCIDYLPIVSDLDMSRQNIGNSGMKSDDTIAQLRQVVKHVVILLRVLHSLTRMLPAYRLHHALTEDAKCLFIPHGTSNGYYSNRPFGSGPGLGGGYYNNRTNDATPQNPSKKQSHLRNMVGGRVNFSFYVSNDSYANQHLSSDTNLFSASSNRPFARHNMNPIRTPFGVLHLSGLYDESLSVERVMTDRAERIQHFNTLWDENPNQFEVDSQTSRSIPVPNVPSHGQEGMIRHDSQSTQQPMTMQLPPRVQPRSRSSSIASQHEGRSRSSSVVSEHIIHDYANNTTIERAKSAEPTPMRARISTDPGRGSCQEKRVLSGLSLALMNQDDDKGEKDSSSASPLLRPVDSGDDNASLRQRMALHHPPPTTYGYAYNVGHPMPSSTSQHGSLGSNNQTTSSPIWGPKSRTNSPIPFRLASTPPQPMFIGSASKLHNALSVTDQEEDEFAPPFRNPLTLQEAPTASEEVTNSLNKLNIGEEPSSDTTQGTIYPSPINTKDAILPPITDLDALASSPFKLSQSVPIGSYAGGGPSSASFFSSLVVGGSAAYGHLDEGFPIALNSGSSSPFYSSRVGNFHNTLLRDNGSLKSLSNQFLFSAPIDDEMPFAVEQESFSGPSSTPGGSIPKSSHQNSASELGASSGIMSSQVLSSLAHRCSTANKLKLFSSMQDNPTSSYGNDDTNMLRDQLAEFQSFGSSAIFTGKSSSSVASSSA